MRDYADSIAFLGQWGRFQQTVFFLLCASIMPNGFGAFTLVFVNDTPTHHCLVPDVNLSQDWQSAIIPVQVSTYCSLFAFRPKPVCALRLLSAAWSECGQTNHIVFTLEVFSLAKSKETL